MKGTKQVGGAERSERKRRQTQSSGSRAVAKARGGASGSKKVIAAVVGIVVLAGIVIGGVVWTNASKNSTEGQSISATDAKLDPKYSGKRDGVVVTTGSADAKETIDMYSDFMCPICGEFHKRYQPQFNDAINSGKLKVRNHMVPPLMQASDPPGYSLEAANASLVAADFGKFSEFQDALFDQQPEEGGRGYDKGQLIEFGKQLGIDDPKFAEGINNGVHEQEIIDDFKNNVMNNPDLKVDSPQGGKGFGTPTVAYNGKAVDRQDTDWFSKILNGTYGK